MSDSKRTGGAFWNGFRVGYNKAKSELGVHKKGEWIPFYDSENKPYGHKCSCCGYHVVMVDIKDNFCSHCGADMRGEKCE